MASGTCRWSVRDRCASEAQAKHDGSPRALVEYISNVEICDGFGEDLETFVSLSRHVYYNTALKSNHLRERDLRHTSSVLALPSGLVATAKVMVALLLVSGAAAAIFTGVAAVNAATTTSSSSSTSINFTIMTDKPNYTGSANIVVTGVAPSGTTAVTVTVNNPARVAIVAVPLAVKQDNSFSTTFQAGGPAWNVTGKYTVIAIVQQQDTIAAAPTTNSTFFYTAVAATTTQTSATSTSSSTTGGGDTSGITSILVIVVVIVIAVGLVGFMLRSRGRRGPAKGAVPAAPKS